MKNKKIIISIFLIFIAIFIYALRENKNKDTNSQDKTIKIGVLQLLSHPALDSIYKGMSEELERQGYKVEIDLQNAQGDQSNLTTMSEKLVKENNDILVAITTPSALSLANLTKEIPIIMAGITYPVEAGLIKSENNPGNNITGVSDRIPIKQELELITQVIPNLETLGLLYTSSEDNSIKQINEAKKFAEELGIKVKVASISNTNDIQQVTESLANSTQAIFIPIDNTLASSMNTVVSVTDKFNIPVFASSDTMVKDGALLGIGVDQYNIGVKTAESIIAVLKGAKPENTPIILANEGVIYLNENKANQLKISINNDIKTKATLVK